MKYKNVYFGGLVIGALALINAVTFDFYFLRIIAGYLFYYFFLGMPVAMFLLRNHFSIKKDDSNFDIGAFVLTSAAFSFLLLYPVAVLITVFEGQSGEAIYSSHLLMGILIALSVYIIEGLGFYLYERAKKSKDDKITNKIVAFKSSKQINKKVVISMLIIVLTSVFFSFYNVNRADLNTGEYDLVYRSYNLVDGMQAGRKSYMLSYIGHPPLAMHANHFSMQIFNDDGLEFSEDWHFRFLGGVMVILCVFLTHLLVYEATGNIILSLICAGLLAVCNSHILLGRSVLRSVFVEFYLLLTIYYYFKYLKVNKREYIWLIGIFGGAIMLTKSSLFPLAFIVPMLVFVDNLKSRDSGGNLNVLKIIGVILLIFSPVILYNILTYLMAGHLDIFFAKFFGVHHRFGYTEDKMGFFIALRNLNQYIHLFVDQFGIPYVLFLIVSMFALIFYKGKYSRLARISSFIIIIMTMFFVIVGFRSYYVTILAPMVVIMIGLLINIMINMKYMKYCAILMGLLLMGYAALYSYNTYLNNDILIDRSWDDSGRAGDYKKPSFCVTCTYSRTTRPWVENWRYKEVAKNIKNTVGPNDLLVLDGMENGAFSENELVDPTFTRRYLNIDLRVKKFYLKEKSKEPIKWVFADTSYRPEVDKVYYLSDFFKID